MNFKVLFKIEFDKIKFIIIIFSILIVLLIFNFYNGYEIKSSHDLNFKNQFFFNNTIIRISFLLFMIILLSVLTGSKEFDEKVLIFPVSKLFFLFLKIVIILFSNIIVYSIAFIFFLILLKLPFQTFVIKDLLFNYLKFFIFIYNFIPLFLIICLFFYDESLNILINHFFLLLFILISIFYPDLKINKYFILYSNYSFTIFSTILYLLCFVYFLKNCCKR